MIDLLRHNAIQWLISLDCAMNVVISTLTGQQAFATETMSAHAWRARSKPFGRVLRPFIDWMFSWQAVDPAFVDEAGAPITSHCQRAFAKERERFYLPAEYR